MLYAAEVSHFSLLIKKSIFPGISSLTQGWQTDGTEEAKLPSQSGAAAGVMHYIQFTLCLALTAMGTLHTDQMRDMASCETGAAEEGAQSSVCRTWLSDIATLSWYLHFSLKVPAPGVI